jgi:hypothetical protein
MQTAEHSTSEAEVPLRKLKRYKSPRADHIPAELMQAFGRDIAVSGHRSGTKNKLYHQWKESVTVPV